MNHLINLLLLLIVCNGAPVVASDLFGKRFASRVDFGSCGRDGRPLLGPAKSWRGVLSAVAAGAALSVLLGSGALFGVLFGALAMTGDLLSSFFKRRLGIAASGRATGLDQLPESLLPALFAGWQLNLPAWVPAAAVLLFFLLAVTLSPLLHRLGIRDRPY